MNETDKKERSYTFKDGLRGLRVMYKTTEGFRGRLAFILAITVSAGVVQALSPLLLGRVVDAIVASAPQTDVIGAMVLFALAMYGNNLLSNMQGRLTSRVDEEMRLTYLHSLFDRLMRLPISFHKTNRHGEVSEKINRGVQAIPSFWSDYVFNVLPQMAYISFALVFAFKANSDIGWILSVSGILYSLLSGSVIQKFARLQRKVHEAYTKARGIANDSLFNVRMVKEAALEDTESKAMHQAWFEDSLAPREEMIRKSRNLALIQSIISNSARVAGLWVAYIAIRDGSLTIGTFSALASYSGGFFSPLQQLFRQWRSIQSSLIAMEDADTISKEETEPYKGMPVPADSHAISFKDVSFGYDGGAPVLDKLSFDVPEGKVIALVGESGVGKSSIIDLISAYYRPQSGSITVGGVDTREIDLPSLRSTIAVVSQEITLFNDSIMNNIRYGRPDASDEAVKKAAEKAKCDFIERLPEKWDQKVGERGMKLSVGQKQRVAIARAFLRDPKILVLDEPTSALDAASERHIVQSLDEIMKGRTTIIIAHRLSTVRKADRILVFKNGGLIEQGTHDELLQKQGEYRKLYDLQSHIG